MAPASEPGGSTGTPPAGDREARAVTLAGHALTLLVLGFVAVGLVALALAVAGLASPLPVAVGSVALWGLLVWAWDLRGAPRLGASGAEGATADGAARPPGALVVAAGLAVVLASGAYNVHHRGEYVTVNRDPGIYVTGGEWIAEHGDLVVQASGPGLDGVEGVVFHAGGQSVTHPGSGQTYLQGAHLFHTLLAVGSWVAGDTGFALVPAVVGALALAVFGWFGLRALPGWAALVTTTALAVSFAWIYTVRSVLSEPTLLLTSFAGAALLLDASRGTRPARFAVAGVVAGTALTARVDAGVVLLLFPVLVVALTWHRTDRTGAPPGVGPGRALTWWAAGFAGPLALAATDLVTRSPKYLGDLGAEVVLIVVGLTGTTAAAALVVVVAGRLPAVGRCTTRVRSRLAGIDGPHACLAAGAAVAVVVLVALTWFVRPHLGNVHLDRGGSGWRVMEGIQQRDGQPADGTRTYAERSIDRISWYTGPVAIAAATAGLALLAARAVRAGLGGSPTTPRWLVGAPPGLRAAGTVGALVLPCLALYVYAPSIYPDHPWMIRRYIPTAIPGILLLAATAVTALVEVARSAQRTSPRPASPALVRGAAGLVAVAVVGALLLEPLRVTAPLRAARWQAGGRAGIDRLCEAIGPDSVVVASAEGATDVTLLPAVRSFCDVPAGGVDAALDPAARRGVVAEAATAAEEAGRTLRVIGPSSESLLALAPEATDLRPVQVLQTSAVVSTIGRPPGDLTSQSLTVWVGDVAPRAT